jgi:large subunit ribosomal protein L23
MQLFDVVRRPLVTEKNTILNSHGKYGFEVARDATKEEIKKAVEKAFKVTVTGVNIMMVRGQEKRVGRKVLPGSPWKKAIVTLKAGDKIQVFEGV